MESIKLPVPVSSHYFSSQINVISLRKRKREREREKERERERERERMYTIEYSQSKYIYCNVVMLCTELFLAYAIFVCTYTVQYELVLTSIIIYNIYSKATMRSKRFAKKVQK